MAPGTPLPGLWVEHNTLSSDHLDRFVFLLFNTAESMMRMVNLKNWSLVALLISPLFTNFVLFSVII